MPCASHEAGPDPASGGASRRGLTLLHVSDLHFGSPFVPRVGEALVRIAEELQPDCLVVSGDITQRATRSQFEQARAFLARLPAVPRAIVPGNHDVPLLDIVRRLRDPFGLYREHVSRELQHVLYLDGAVVVCINSTTPRRSISNGRLHREQLDLCERTFRDLPAELFRVVVTHHHFLGAPDFAWDHTMRNAAGSLDRLIELRVDLILNGHLHRAHIGSSLDVHRGADPEHGIVIVQCGTTTSRRGRGREREKNTLNVVQLGGDQIRVTHYMYFEDPAQGFAPVSRHAFPRPGARVLRR